MKIYEHELRQLPIREVLVTERRVKKSYCDNIFTFDLEATSAWRTDKGIIAYEAGHDAEWWNEQEALALCYIWQFSADGEVYYGRELKDFCKVLDDLPTDTTVIIWVHNLAYEFQYLCNLFTWKRVFARQPHKPITAVPNEYPNVQFRCSYMLTRLSLDAWGQQIGVEKATGDLDYDKIRTPLTELTEKEMHYAEQDCLVVEAGIKQYVKRYGHVYNIPLTQTGTVRREVKERLLAEKGYKKKIKKLVPKSADEYKMLQAVFAGGYTHANAWYAGVVVDELVHHFDFASSYPTVMLCEKYPMTPWYYNYLEEMPDDSEFDRNAYIFQLKFSQLNSISENTYIQASKCISKNAMRDNGRIMMAEELTMWMTEQDWITIKNNYTWGSMEILKAYRSTKDYLPKAFREYILELYENKTKLKGVEEFIDLYNQSKQYINSLFGMCVTALLQADVTFDGEWHTKAITREQVEDKLEKLANFSPRESRYFLSYSWGCWVTAYARRNLWKCIESCDRDMIYCDTDSIFVRGNHDFTWYNEEITEKIKKSCEETGLDFSKTHPADRHGEEHPLGVFASEQSCIQFITLGAKRYVERRNDGKLYLTVAGINKGAVAVLEDNIYNFKDGLVFDKDHPSVTKKIADYITEQDVITWEDGYISTYRYGINLRNTGYTLTMTDEYKELIMYEEMTMEDAPAEFIIALRGRFI